MVQISRAVLGVGWIYLFAFRPSIDMRERYIRGGLWMRWFLG